MSKSLFLSILLTALVGCSAPAPVVTPHKSVKFPSPLDGKENEPNSWHCAHVTVVDWGDFILDDGTRVKLYFTGGSQPHLPDGLKGTLYVSVPSYAHEDADNTYYFQKFATDREPSKESAK